MLPLINLKAGDLFSVESLPAAESLMPEGASALDGEFASVLQASVAPDFSSLADTGLILPATGNTLPPAPLLADAALPTNVQIQDGPTLELFDTANEGNNGMPVDRTLAEMLAGQVQRDLKVSESAPVQSHELLNDIPAVQLTPPSPAITDDAATPRTQGAMIIASDLAEDLTDASPVQQLSIPATPVVAVNHDRAEPVERAIPPDNRPQTVTLGQPTPSLQASVVASEEVPVPAMPLQAANARSNLVSDQPRQARTAINPTSDPILPTVADDRPLVARDELPDMLRPVTANMVQTTVPVDTQLQIEPGPRFGNELTTALARQPQTSALPMLNSSIELPVQQQGWDNTLAERVTFMANTRLQNAEIRLTPADLGPLKIQLAIEDGTANVTFHSQHVATREAIEQALPRLREMLAENGLSLGQASVDDDGMNQREREAQTNNRSQLQADDSESQAGEAAKNRSATRQLNGLVDTFA